jgi:hypothetical protein
MAKLSEAMMSTLGDIWNDKELAPSQDKTTDALWRRGLVRNKELGASGACHVELTELGRELA